MDLATERVNVAHLNDYFALGNAFHGHHTKKSEILNNIKVFLNLYCLA